MHKNEKPAADGTARGLHKADQLGGAIGRTVGQGIARAQDGVAVYAADRLIGFLVARRHGVDALTASGQNLGRFNDEASGARALLAEAGAAK